MIAPVNPKQVANAGKGGSAVASVADDARLMVKDAQSEMVAAKEAIEVQRLLEPAPTMTEKVLSRTDSMMNFLGAIPMLPMFTGFLLGSVPEAMGKFLGVRAMRNFGERMKTYHMHLEELKFADVGSRLGISKPVGAAADATAGVVGTVAEKAGRITRFSRWRRDANLGKSLGSFEDARKTLAQMDVSALHPEVREHVDALNHALNGTHITAKVMEPVGAIAGHAGGTSAPMSSLHVPASSTTHANIDAIKTRMGHLNDLLENGKEVIKDGVGMREAVVATESEVTGRTFGKFLKQMNKGVEQHNTALFHENTKAGIRSLPGKISKAPAVEGLMHGAFIAGSAVSMATDAHGFFGNLKTLKQMYTDMTGQKNPSTFKVLLGDVPDAVREARGKLMKSLVVSEGADAAGMAANVLGAVKGHRWGMMKSTVAYMVPGMVSGAYVSTFGQTSLPIYSQLARVHKAGHQVPVEGYAALLNIASKDLHARGENNPFTIAIAQQYAAANASPAQVLKDIESGALMVKVHELIKSHEAESHPANNARGSHAARVSGKAPAQAQPPVGSHTKRLQEMPSTGIVPGIVT